MLILIQPSGFGKGCTCYNTHRMNTYGQHFPKNLKIPLLVLLAAAGVYIVFINLLVSAVLVPSFMNRLDKIREITDKIITEQIHTGDLQSNRTALWTISSSWAEEADSETLTVYSGDGLKLTGRFFPPDGAAAPGTRHRYALLLHGYTGEKEAMYPIAYWYHRQGYRVLCPDFRSHGESEGDFIGMGYVDRADVLLWIGRILSRDPDAEIVIHGLSMGASCALMMCGMEELPGNVKAVVADSAFTDAYTMFTARIGEWFGLPAFPIIDSARFFIRLRGGYDLKDASALKAVRKSSIPTLFVYGEEDRMIPVSMTPQLYEAASCEKYLLPVAGAGHTQAYEKAPVVYFGAVSSFLDKYLCK